MSTRICRWCDSRQHDDWRREWCYYCGRTELREVIPDTQRQPDTSEVDVGWAKIGSPLGPFTWQPE